MTWTAICVNLDCEVSHTFTFTGSHDKRAAFGFAQEQTSFEVIAIVPGDHPVYHPGSDE
jgi:hypothetical protein